MAAPALAVYQLNRWSQISVAAAAAPGVSADFALKIRRITGGDGSSSPATVLSDMRQQQPEIYRWGEYKLLAYHSHWGGMQSLSREGGQTIQHFSGRAVRWAMRANHCVCLEPVSVPLLSTARHLTLKGNLLDVVLLLLLLLQCADGPCDKAAAAAAAAGLPRAGCTGGVP
jgi:hypothetical protein